MTLLHYFFSPAGRIGRLEYWLGMLALLAVSVAVSMMIEPASVDQQPGAKPVGAGSMPVPGLATTLWNLLLAWPSAAIAIKRFNDRDWPGWLGYVLGFAMAGLIVANYFDLMLDPDRMGAGEKFLLLALVIAFFWSIIDNGFKRGTEGPNRFGPDPAASRV